MKARSTQPAQLPQPGDTVGGKYLLERLLGQGGMGAVFAAKHIKLSKAVAIKIMLADASNPEASGRFINEGRAAANIQNEHVVRVDDVDEEMGYAYMVLELLDGEDLSQLLERELTHRLAPHVAVGYVLQGLHGVMQAHAIGIVHRDLKPSNLFLAKRKDGTVVIKVLDFGISKAQGSSALAASPNALTSTKAMLGSPLYMSPEQLRSSKSVDHRADIWAMGIILYELITGTLPFMGESLGELFAAILETEAPPLSRHADVPRGLEEIVARCLQRKPENRFQNAGELIQALTPFAVPLPGMGMNVAAMSAPITMPSANAVTPSYQSGPLPSLPGSSVPGSAVAVSGSQPRFNAFTTPLGAVTPPSGAMLQTGSGWQSTGSRNHGLPVKSKAPIIIAAAAIATVCFAAAAFGVVVWTKEKDKKAALAAEGANSAVTIPSSSSSAAVVVPSEPPPPSPSAAPATTHEDPSTASTAATAPSAAAHEPKGETKPGAITKKTTPPTPTPVTTKTDPQPPATQKPKPPPPPPPPPDPVQKTR